MTIETLIDLGHRVDARTYENATDKDLARLREGFYAQRESARWGVLVKLEGEERIVLADFGEVPEELFT